MPGRKTRLAVLFGGRSGEHQVSCLSAAAVLAQLDRDRFEVTAIGITPAGRWVRVDPGHLLAGDGTLPEITGGADVTLRSDTTSAALSIPGSAQHIDIDVVFPLLHGPYGEDGTIQGLLELVDLPYVGPGVFASAAAMDKEMTKRLLASAGLAVAPSVIVRAAETSLSVGDRDRLGLPVFVKPARGGSSLGVGRVDAWEQLADALANARRHDPKVLVEAAISGREVECGVLEFPDGHLEASLPATIRVADDRFYDFDAKYLDDVATFDIPAALPDETVARVRSAAIEAFRAIDAQGLARVDFFVGDDGSLTINEINTMPGFTPISMYPQMWAATGVDYPTLLTTLVDTALARGTGLR